MNDLPLNVDQATVRFGSYTAVNRVSFQVKPGKILGIAGPNGSGKTTLLRSLFGAQALAAGTITLEGNPLHKMRASQISKKVSVVSQFEHDTDRMRVEEFVLLGRAPHRTDFQGYSDTDHDIVSQALHRVGMSGVKDRYFTTLSGGERQRVLIARALTQQCPCMLLDEPTNHLDVKYQHQVLTLVREVAPTAVIVLHDLNLVARYCDEVIVMNHGAIACQGHPTTTLSKELIADIYGVEAVEVYDGDIKQFIFR
ncbi:Iron(3+)-hydroxamate import ATP-binding protein FhuC [Trueperella pyogenes]|uniref:ABC transporter ATP-binding protein n=1 Tax=Trueperella pyogenes TaxID=1661 RepID=UPI000E0875F5|nr:ABC transporter ATP-binding protein [Trueperella pyogenes]MBB3026014.1 iron complex transport system ATP-binding protein [Trueperella pyogenes]SUO88218.1 Iron(3+)-hydroxamate import ATP-binding protein FhuC [Trueperella pyogenes]